MRIILDVMGADNPCEEIIRGAISAKEEYGVDITLVGDADAISAALQKERAGENLFTVVPTTDVITMEDAPMSIVRAHKDCSMAKALSLLVDGEGDAVVSAGNTGAYFTGATLTVGRIKGIRRSALGTILPFTNPVLMLDCGANVTVTADYLQQFAILGSVYMEKVCGIGNPRVGLVNNGAEEHKGSPLYVEAHKLLKEMNTINFIGNVEGKEIPFDKCDVLVCDGFTGNVVLKTCEGLSRFLVDKMKGMFHSATGAVAGVLVRGKTKEMKRSFDPNEYGGAPFLGLAKPVIKAHGSSDAEAVKNAIRQAIAYAETGVIAEIEKRASALSQSNGKENAKAD